MKGSRENESPTKKHKMSLENQENSENTLSATKKVSHGKENHLTSSTRRKKAERKSLAPTSQLDNQAVHTAEEDGPKAVVTQVSAIEEEVKQEEVKEELSNPFNELKDQQVKSLFKHHKQQAKQDQVTTQQQQLILPVEISKVIQVDSQVINFGRFVSGKILGSTLQITNTSQRDQIIEITVDQQSDEYSCDEIFGPYLREELPFEYKDESQMPNSEKLFKSWYIENPISKDLVKTITLRMSPLCEKEFIIVMKAPTDRVQYSLASFLSIRFVKSRYLAQSILEKKLKQNGDQLEDIDFEQRVREKNIDSEIRVMLIGRLENPKLKCMRELHHIETDCNVIPLGVKQGISQQKFRIPFKNLSTTQDADFDFTFVKTAPVEGESQDLTSYLEFFCQPGNLKINAGQQQFLNVLIKVNTVGLNGLEGEDKLLLDRPIRKLLIARLKETGIMFSFFVTIDLITQ